MVNRTCSLLVRVQKMPRVSRRTSFSAPVRPIAAGDRNQSFTTRWVSARIQCIHTAYTHVFFNKTTSAHTYSGSYRRQCCGSYGFSWKSNETVTARYRNPARPFFWSTTLESIYFDEATRFHPLLLANVMQASNIHLPNAYKHFVRMNQTVRFRQFL
jgi:hypothetical protein